MKTQTGKNTYVVGIKGNFDDAQSGVKKIFSDKEFNQNYWIIIIYYLLQIQLI